MTKKSEEIFSLNANCCHRNIQSNKSNTSNIVKHIFEHSFYDVQEGIDDVEAFLKENGEDLM